MSGLLFSNLNSSNRERLSPRIETKVNGESNDFPLPNGELVEVRSSPRNILNIAEPQPSMLHNLSNMTKPRIERKETIHPKIEKLLNLREQMAEQCKRREEAAKKLAKGQEKFYLLDISAQSNTVAEKHASWRHHLHEFLHARSFELFLTGALIVDIILVIVDLFLEAEFPRCVNVKGNAVSCCPNTNASSSHRRLAGGGGGGGGGHGGHSCEIKGTIQMKDYPPYCDEHKHAELHTLHYVLIGLSLLILATFLVELLLVMTAIGVKKFCKHALYVLDLFVVVVSLTMEIMVFMDMTKTGIPLSAISGVFIIFRVWRFIRIGHGFVTAAVDTASLKKEKETHAALLAAIDDLQQLVTGLLEKLGDKSSMSISRAELESFRDGFENISKGTSARHED